MAVGPLDTLVTSDPAAFADLAEEWDALVLGAARRSPFLLHGWVAAWWSVYRPDVPARCITVRRDGRLVGALAITIERRGPVRVATLAGGLALGDVLVGEPDARAICAEVAAAIRRQPVDVVDFDGIARESVLATCLPAPFRLAQAIPAPTLNIADGWDAAYARTVGSATRRTNRRRLKQLAQAGNHAFVRYDTEADIAAALDDAFRVHARRWAGRRDTSPFGTPDGQAFHRAALRALSRSGYVRLLELRLDDVPIAFQLYFQLGDAMFTYRLAFDPDYSRFSPGALTMLEAIRQASAEGAAMVEFLRGDDPYKLALADRADGLVRLVGLPANLRGRAYMEATAGATALRSWLRRNERLRDAVRRARAVGHRRTAAAGDG